MKTISLIGPALDWAVAKCEGKNGVLHDDGITRCIMLETAKGLYAGRFNPSTNWSQGGPIIEREKIKIAPNIGGTWHGQIRHETSHPLVAHRVLAGWTNKHGPTPLIAAMRCFVASRLGDEVDIPPAMVRS